MEHPSPYLPPNLELHCINQLLHLETVLAMLKEGPGIVNSVGATVLHFAAEGGYVEIKRDLVGRGCNVNAKKDNSCTPPPHPPFCRWQR